MTHQAIHEYDITVVVTAHAEGRLAHRTMRSVMAAVEEAKKQDLHIEIVIVLDTPTSETLAYFSRWTNVARVFEVANKDPGLNRNVAAQFALGKYLAIVDADDLFGREWLALAYRQAEHISSKHFIVHADYTVYFDNRREICRHPSTDNPAQDWRLLASHNFWTSVLFAPSATFREIPFAASALNSGFGYEDWHWIISVLSKGGKVAIAPGTCKFTRYKPRGSRLSMHDYESALLPPIGLLEPRHFLRNIAELPPSSTQCDRCLEGQRTQPFKERLKVWFQSVPRSISRTTESYPRVQKTLGKVYRLCVPNKEGISRDEIPTGVMEQWRAVAKIEPQLFPSDTLLQEMKWCDNPPDTAAEVYAELCKLVAGLHQDVTGPQFTHVFVLPWLKTGGADLLAINYIHLVASVPSHRVLVITTEDEESPWSNRLPASVHLLEIGKVANRLRMPARIQIFAQFLVQLQPKVIHLINSKLGNEVFVQHGKALSQISKLFAPAFCVDIDSQGAHAGYIVTHLPDQADWLSAIMSDNQEVLSYLEQTFAIQPEKMVVQYQPVSMTDIHTASPKNPDDPLDVLWAGRLDRLKRPDLVLEIARRCQDDNIFFHVYGTSVIKGRGVAMDGHKPSNLKYHGPFDGLRSLQPSRFDLFLNTSQWDGMPNILLEATAEGLPIVSSDVGGIGELIIHNETGLLVSPFDDVDQYVVALRRLKNDPELRKRLLLECRKLVSERHSWRHFVDDVNRLPGYLEAPCQLEQVQVSLLTSPHIDKEQQATRP